MKCKFKLCVPFHRKKHATVSIPHIETITHSSRTSHHAHNTNTCNAQDNESNSADSLTIGKEMRREILSLLGDSMTSLAPHGSDEDLYIYVSASMNSLNNNCQQQQQLDGGSSDDTGGRFKDGKIKQDCHENEDRSSGDRPQDSTHGIHEKRCEIQNDKHGVQDGTEVINIDRDQIQDGEQEILNATRKVSQSVPAAKKDGEIQN